MKEFLASDLILTSNNTIYHLDLRPDELGDLILWVGDPARVEKVSRHFDTLDIVRSHRELVTHTGTLEGIRISCISSGMGPDNMDIVLNEADHLANTDFLTRQPKPIRKKMMWVRLGTSGSIHPDIFEDDILVDTMATGLDNIPWFYDDGEILSKAAHPEWGNFVPEGIKPYRIAAHPILDSDFKEYIRGEALTLPGFYGPQGRETSMNRNPWMKNVLNEAWKWGITNLEMESSALFYLGKKMGHPTISLNVILAQRHQGRFSANPAKAVDILIKAGIPAALRWYRSLNL